MVINYHLNQKINLRKLIISSIHPATKFILLFLIGLIIWFTFYHFLYKIDLFYGDSQNTLLSFSKLLGHQSNFILETLGINTILEINGEMVVTKLVDYPYNHGVWIGEPCNGIKIFGVFSIFIICFQGKILNKGWFILFGILILHFLNVIRIATLTYIAAVQPLWLNFNHNITFQIIMYGTMGALWLIWIKKLSKTEKSN